MEFSCAYFHHNRNVLYILFAKRDNIIYINLNDVARVVMTMDMLFEDYLLAGYYLLSLCLTKDIRDIQFFEEGAWGEQVLCNWCISSKVVWKLSRITDYIQNTAGFTSDPREWICSVSSRRKIENFFQVLYANDYYEHCPYKIIDYHISCEVSEIDDELKSIEEKTSDVDFTIKTVALLTGKSFPYSLPLDIIPLFF
jgi:hypothetical protein